MVHFYRKQIQCQKYKVVIKVAIVSCYIEINMIFVVFRMAWAALLVDRRAP